MFKKVNVVVLSVIGGCCSGCDTAGVSEYVQYVGQALGLGAISVLDIIQMVMESV